MFPIPLGVIICIHTLSQVGRHPYRHGSTGSLVGCWQLTADPVFFRAGAGVMHGIFFIYFCRDRQPKRQYSVGAAAWVAPPRDVGIQFVL
jgi:hypothetical protein